ncbi:alpha-protein kinase 1 isoform X3 [Pseudophryne corroboree]|uniref:alpha-protein kinase 1 isoform X3 n=1 Tax=Pseudophryne corroboree TaxID=495146 RepID=UPI0030818241
MSLWGAQRAAGPRTYSTGRMEEEQARCGGGKNLPCRYQRLFYINNGLGGSKHGYQLCGYLNLERSLLFRIYVFFQVIDHRAPRDTQFTVKWETVIMSNQDFEAVLQACKRMLDVLASEVFEPSEEEKNDYQRCEERAGVANQSVTKSHKTLLDDNGHSVENLDHRRHEVGTEGSIVHPSGQLVNAVDEISRSASASLPDDLRTLIQEAKEMKWPFVPERWQYKQAVGPEDKTNLQDMINPRLHDLLVYLKTSIMVGDSGTAAAIVFLIDRFLYWADASTKLLSVAKALHKVWPSTPIAPQVVIRQARISVNSGKLLKAEYILSSLISNNGATGTWQYSEDSDRLLVQSVCIQIRGQILQKLGMWYEAAELIWTSLVGFFELPIPDKKGISTSLGVLADIFISMSEEDYQRFKKNSNVGLTLLEKFEHKLLSAAEACKLAATYSLYTPLFVLTNLNIRGTCLLSYSLSKDCTVDKRSYYLSQAKESFEIGLLTKKKGDHVTSKQELYSFVKAAFCLANVHKWLNGETAQNEDVNVIYSEAMEKLAKYNILPDKHDKADLANYIMSLVSSIKELFKVQPIETSDNRSYVPDSYRDCVDKNIVIGKVRFNKLLDMYSQHHNSVCDVFDRNCRNHVAMDVKSGVCVTALKTSDTVSTIDNSPIQTAGDHDRSSDKSGKRRKFVRSDAISHSVDEDSSKNVRRSLNKRYSSSLSNSSFSWECIPEHNEKEPHITDDSSKVENPGSSAKIGEIVNLETNNGIEIPFQGLSVQEGKSSDNQSNCPLFSEKQTGETNRTNDASQSISITGNNEISATNKLVSTMSCEMGNDHYSDYESFVIVDPLTETESVTENKLSNVSGKRNDFKGDFTGSYGNNVKGETLYATDEVFIGIHENLPKPPGHPSAAAGQRLFHVIDVEGETKDTTDDVDIEVQRNMPKLPGPSGQIAGESLFNGIDVEGETKDTTDDVDIEVHGKMQIPPGPSGHIAGQMLFHGIDIEDETKYSTDDVDIEVHGNMPIPSGPSGHIAGQRLVHGIDIEGETKDATDDALIEIHPSVPAAPSVSVISHNNLASFSEDKLLATEDRFQKQFLNQQWSIESSTAKIPLKEQNSGVNLLTSSGNSKAMAGSSDEPCETTEEGDNKWSLSFSSSNGSSSWSKLSQFSRSLSESNSLNSSVNSFVILQPEITEQMRQACSLDATDYERLLSGVNHEWLLKRLKDTGVFSFQQSHKTYNALLLKFSKKSELWTAQETVVHFGDDVDVKNEGKQRKAFWIYFLHQDETLGRYVGKAYKKHKELLYHFVDVERQMTAQYYVTEFNKRLYEMNIPTQIFYIPSAVLLITEGGSIKGCVSVEPYILGEFVKLTNNTKTVRMQYEATKYGLAFGHFAYEFSNFSDIVVDLQGWVTGSDKGEALIYLTDPQIHSVKDTPGATCLNFGSDGIYMFFNVQHKECNEICHSLSLTRPDIKVLEKSSKAGTSKDRRHHFKNSKGT